MIYVLSIIAALWLWGWIASVRETNVGQMAWGFQKIGGMILLFFVWPYVALCMMSQGDV